MRTFGSTDELPADFRQVFLEPHLDDVVLSCGGLLANLAAAGTPALVVTLFAGTPPNTAPLTDFAAHHHVAWGTGHDPIGARRAEQVAALDRVGADWLPLAHLDAIYRGDRYRSNDELFGPPRVDEQPLIESIAAHLGAIDRRLGRPGWYVPLAVGQHVDHQVALAASRGLADRRGYEDFPYAGRPGAVEQRTAELGLTQFELVDIAATLDQKIAAIHHYRSQLATLFDPTPGAAEVTRRFALSRGSAEPAERYWYL